MQIELMTNLDFSGRKNRKVEQIKSGGVMNRYETIIKTRKYKGKTEYITLDSELVNAIILDNKKRFPNAQVWDQVKKIRR